jgi:SAM-dependent methyltransferase
MLDNKDARSLARYNLPSSFIYQPRVEHVEDNWRSYLGGPYGRCDIKKWIPTSATLLNLGGRWLEAKVYEELGYDCTNLVLSTQVHELFIEGGFKSILNDMCDMRDVDNESFGAIISVQSLEHVWYPYKALLEMYRVLEVGGRLVLNVPQWFAEETEADVPDPSMANLQHISLLHTHQMRFMVRVAGFKLLHQEVPDTHQQTLYCEKLSLEALESFSENPKHAEYYKGHVDLLKAYCEC